MYNLPTMRNKDKCFPAIFIILGLFCLHVIPGTRAFSGGAPDFSCKDPSAFHTRKINDTHEGIIMPQSMTTSPFRLDVNVRTFRPGDRITGMCSIFLRYISKFDAFVLFFSSKNPCIFSINIVICYG